jgi:predicted HTH transcriptional regulator
MTDHDGIKGVLNPQEYLERYSSKFNELTLDIQEIYSYSKDPFFVSALLFKLAEERKKTNELLSEMNKKYDEIMFFMKTKDMDKESALKQENQYQLLCDADQRILQLVEAQGQVTAFDVMQVMGYKGQNAASQRLNKLFKDGHLRKLQSGRKVLYIIKS